MQRIYFSLLLLCFFYVDVSFSQDVVEIEGVTVTSVRVGKLSGYKQSDVDTIAITNNNAESLSSLLAMHSPLFIKTYGQGGLATCSFRGTGASHTKILWNGIDINSPMMGQTDFSVVPVYIIDNVTLNHGGSSVCEGSGALGGSISLTNSVSWNEKTKIEFVQNIGSFNTYNTMISLQCGKNDFRSKTHFVRGVSENEYPYKNIFIDRNNPPTNYRKGAGYNHYDITQELYLKTNDSDVFSMKLWGQQYNRDIAAPISVASHPKNEKQENKSFKSVVDWKHSLPLGMLKVQFAFVHDYLYYTNEIANIYSDNTSDRYFGNISYNRNVYGFIEFSSGMRYEKIYVKSINYTSDKVRNELSLFAGVEVHFSDLILARVMLRQRVVDKEVVPAIPTIGFDIGLLKNEELFLKANVSRNYHMPTMNDLYWMPGGNINLKPEKGVTIESGLLYKKSIKESIKLETEITGFYNDINNWIIWLPDSVRSYWTPRNIRNATSKGIEATLKLSYKHNDYLISCNNAFSYTDARNRKVNDINDLSKGKQLIYVPKYSFGSHVNVVIDNMEKESMENK